MNFWSSGYYLSDFAINRGFYFQKIQTISEISKYPEDPPRSHDPTRYFRPPPTSSGDDPATDRCATDRPSSLTGQPPPTVTGNPRSEQASFGVFQPDSIFLFRRRRPTGPLGSCSSPPQEPPSTLGSSSRPPYTAELRVEVLGHRRLSS